MLRFIFIFALSLAAWFLVKAQSMQTRIVFAGSVFVLSFLLILVESRIRNISAKKIISGVIGFVVGLLVGQGLYVISAFLIPIEEIRLAYRLVLCVFTSYYGYLFLSDHMSDLSFLMGKVAEKKEEGGPAGFFKYKILDTSAIIDGRILDIGEAGFIEGVFIIPKFVLQELQLISDSQDGQKRIRGRRGLDMVNKIKNSQKMLVEILDIDYPDIRTGVDAKLVRLAQENGGMVVTTDFNLNKVAKIQNVKIYNVNELADSLKPIVMPQETLEIEILKIGKDRTQGIGYLEDGTMVVVEGGAKLVNKKRKVEVTSILQTNSGRMIFAK